MSQPKNQFVKAKCSHYRANLMNWTNEKINHVIKPYVQEIVLKYVCPMRHLL